MAVGIALAVAFPVTTKAQTTPAPSVGQPVQDPAMVFRSGLWKQWIYWVVPGPKAYASIQRIVAEVNGSRSSSGLPLLISNPTYKIVVSVFDERNARGADGSSTLPITSNQEAFLATFVDDAAGGSEVLFLTDALRSSDQLTAKGVPGVSATVERSIMIRTEHGVEQVETRWQISSPAGDQIEFKAQYPSTAITSRVVGPASRTDYAKFNLTHNSDIIYRSTPTRTYRLFAREEGNFIDLKLKGVYARVQIDHHDSDVNAIFNDPKNVPEMLIALDRDVRIEKK
jgi:hypothetical protein